MPSEERIFMPFPSKQKILYDRLLKEVLQNSPAGTRLPSERTLAANFRVARMTLRETLNRLAQEKRIIRRRTGTFVLDQETGTLPSDKKKSNVYILLPCPDFSVSAGYFSYKITTECIRGAMNSAIRYGAQVITIPVSLTNNPEQIDLEQISMLRKSDIVFFVGDWYKMLLPVLVERGCRIGAILPDMDPESEYILTQIENFRIFKRPMLANYLPEVLNDLKEKGKHSPFLFGREGFSMFFEHPAWNIRDHIEEIQRDITPDKLRIKVCPRETRFVEQCAMIQEIYEKQPFDVLIFDAITDPGQPVSLRKLCNLPEDVLIYVRGKNLLGSGNDSRKNICYSRSGFLECSQELTEQLLTCSDRKNIIMDFKHIIIKGENSWKENSF